MSYNRPDQLQIAASAAVDVRAIPVARLTSEGRWRVEAMRSYERPVLIWFTRGQGRITAAGVKRGYGAHNAIFLPAGTMHGFDTIGQVFGTVLHLPRVSGNPWPETPVHLRIRDAQPQAELTALIDGIERELKDDRPAKDRAIAAQVAMISVWLDRNGDAADRHQGKDGSPAARRLAARYSRLLERDFRTSRGVADYAEELGVTPTHLNRCCRQTAGLGAHDLLSDRKLFEARRLLRETGEPVSSIAAALGFRSAAYFSRAFKVETGQNPSSFRSGPAT